MTKMGLQKGKKNFTINVAEHIGYPGGKGLELTLSPVMYNSEKNSSKWITNLDVQNKILKLLEDNIGLDPHDLEQGKSS